MPCMVKKGFRAATDGPSKFVNSRGQVKRTSAVETSTLLGKVEDTTTVTCNHRFKILNGKAKPFPA